jgi:hypothetical protein
MTITFAQLHHMELHPYKKINEQGEDVFIRCPHCRKKFILNLFSLDSDAIQIKTFKIKKSAKKNE